MRFPSRGKVVDNLSFIYNSIIVLPVSVKPTFNQRGSNNKTKKKNPMHPAQHNGFSLYFFVPINLPQTV